MTEFMNSSNKQPQNLVVGSTWKDCRFVDQTPFEVGLFCDTSLTHDFQVRGATYLDDKIKQYTGPALFRLCCAEMIKVDVPEEGDVTAAMRRTDHIASIGRVKHRVEALSRLAEPPEVLVMNYQYPGTPPVSNIAIFVASPTINTILPTDTPQVKATKSLWKEFKNVPKTETERIEACHASRNVSWWPTDITWGLPEEPGVLPWSDFRNNRFKIVPRVIEGNWIVRAAMPAALPCLLGKKVQQRYFRGSNYFEIDVEVGSSAIASQIIGVLRGYAKYVIADYGIILQGESNTELPEMVIACHNINNLDYDHLKNIKDLPVPIPAAAETTN